MQKKISFSLVFTQTCNFFRNRITQFVLISLALSLIYTFFTFFFIKENNLTEQIYVSQNLTKYFSFLGLACLLNIILKAINIATVSNLYVSDKLNLNLLLSKTLSNTLKIILFYLIIGIFIFFIAIMLTIVIIGLSIILPNPILLLLIILVLLVPMLLFAIFCNLFLGSLADPNQKSIFELISLNIQLSKKYWLPALLMLLINIVFLIVFTNLVLKFNNNNFVLDTIFSFISIFFDIFVTSFFYRLYMLATHLNNSALPPKNNDEHQNNNYKLII
ncbi:hypothetical protein [Gilliamella sp. Gris1-4]|uniref:hypothetical protein n=1 Tax=Gilliamella sp. Gris1-4 TaxID=3120244 RepID=UPI00080DF2DF|nr:hypothetical protein [Gilliamella apicola]OCG35330.1 hypothetical protein A9G31_08465 [Gilliamella apicola]OCG68824.1 hypothetical protein A9G39_01945 [Gilliamella apicola]